MITNIFSAGFRDIVSVVPPEAQISPLSKISDRDLGKIPGRKNRQGSWGGYDWQGYEPSYNDVQNWEASGANFGLKAGRFPAIDIDCTDTELAELIEGLALNTLGMAPVRIGKPPKRLLMYRTTEPFGRLRLWFKYNGDQHLIEVLGDGQQFVIAGKHPDGFTYTIDRDLAQLGADGLTEITREKAQAFLAEVQTMLELFGAEAFQPEGNGSLSIDRSHINQEDLKGDLDLVRAAVAATPNDNATFPGRDDYLRYGYAIKAALADHPAEAQDVFTEWALRWEGNDRSAGNDLQIVEADWQRMKPPFEVGADLIYDLAKPYLQIAPSEFTYEEAPAETSEASVAPIAYSDAALARRFLARHKDEVRHCRLFGGWLFHDGQKWVRDTTGHVEDLIRSICEEASAEALHSIEQANKAERVATKCAAASTMRAVNAIASGDRAVAVDEKVWDTNLMALNTPAGVVDLTTGELKPHDAAGLHTRMTTVSPDFKRKPAVWLQFLDMATKGDKELQSYLQRLAGYALTGSTKEQMLAFFYGDGGNGKGTFLNALQDILGTYSVAAAMDTFTASKFDRHTTELASLQGARLVTAQETQQGRSWDEARLKALTGGDPVTARFMRQDNFTFTPQFTLVFAGNHRPAIQNVDAAIRRRIHLVPFTNKPPSVDRDLGAKLRAEWGAILAWAIEGCVAWQQQSLKPPAAVLDSTAEYFEDEDTLGRWLAERVVPSLGNKIPTSELFHDWREWCAETGEMAGKENGFSRTLQNRGYARGKHPRTRRSVFEGIALRFNDFEEFPATSQKKAST